MTSSKVPVAIQAQAARVSELPRLDVNRILDQVAEHPLRRRPASAQSVTEPPGSTLAPSPELWTSTAPELPEKDVYPLWDLLQPDDEDFIHQAYRVLLRRSPDEAGLATFLPALREGRLDKLAILGQLRFSSEGMRHGVPVKGLRAAQLLARLKAHRGIGPVVSWIHALVRLGRHAQQAPHAFTRQSVEIHRLGHLFNQSVQRSGGRLSAVEDAVRQVRDDFERRLADADTYRAVVAEEVDRLRLQMEARLAQLDESIEVAGERQQREADRVSKSVDLVNSRCEAIEVGLAFLRDLHTEAERRRAASDALLGSVSDSLQGLRLSHSEAERDRASSNILVRELSASVLGVLERERALLESSAQAASSVAARLDVLEIDVTSLSEFRAHVAEQEHLAMESARREAKQAEDVASAGEARARMLDQLYASFEERFRGPEELVRQRVAPYVDVVREAGAGGLDAPVIDIGCGRGEWLQLLRENGLSAKGIDRNQVFAAEVAAKGDEVIIEDAVQALAAMAEASAGAITSMHLVEHLELDAMVGMIDEAFRVLRPGGVLILETPNPENLDVSLINFYMDPTHLNPLPPEFLRWLTEARGFVRARIERLLEARELQAPALVPEDAAGAESINNLIARTHVAPDYAIIAYKPSGDGA